MHDDVHASDERLPIDLVLEIGQFYPFDTGRFDSPLTRCRTDDMTGLEVPRSGLIL